MTTFDELAQAEFVSIESFRKNGTSVKTPVWMTEDNGVLYCWTGRDAWKVKRIRNHPRVNLAICDRMGNVESDWVTAYGQVLDNEQAIQQQRGRMAKKYGLMFRMFQVMGMITRAENVVIAFTPDATPHKEMMKTEDAGVKDVVS